MRKALFLLCTWLFAYNTILFSQDTTQVSERIEVIQQMLDRSSLQADIWWYGWLGTYSAATVGQGVVCFTTDQLAITELQIWTQPTRTLRDFRKYQQQYLQKKPIHAKSNPAEFYLKTTPVGVLVGVRF